MWPNPQETEDLVTFTEEILNEKLNFLCSVTGSAHWKEKKKKSNTINNDNSNNINDAVTWKRVCKISVLKKTKQNIEKFSPETLLVGKTNTITDVFWQATFMLKG